MSVPSSHTLPSIPNYRVIEQLYAGYSTAVYRAFADTDNRSEALKRSRIIGVERTLIDSDPETRNDADEGMV